MVCVTHSRKASGDIIDSVLGTSGSTAGCDSVWSLKRSANAPGEGVLEVVGRDFEGITYGLRFNNGTPFGWQVTAEGADAEMNEERRDIVMELQQEGAKKPAEIGQIARKEPVTAD
jgi:hypothetical protein